MKNDSATLLPKFYTISKKATHRCFNSRIVFLFSIVFSLSASLVAQTVDYNLPKNWMCHPILKATDVAREQNLSLTVQNPDLSIDTVINYSHYADSLVDIFYIYPTIDMSFTMGNTAMSSIDTVTAKFVYREQAGPFARFGRVFAPYYRQATIYVFVDTLFNDSTQMLRAKYMEIAYNDIDSAFSHYLLHYNNGRKIILMGHSQGSLMMRFLLRKRFDNNPALMSQLVVAVSAGEPNYVSADGSRTGGSLQNIKTCPPRDSVQECGCLMNWRSWKNQPQVSYLSKASFFFNPFFVDKGLIYQTLDTVNYRHIESSYDFGYETTQKLMPRYISLDATMSNYFAYDGLFKAKTTIIPTIPGSSYLLIDPNFIANDQRKIDGFPGIDTNLQCKIPIPAWTKNYHIWDFQFVQWDLLNILPGMIANCGATGVSEKKTPQNSILIYPNPTNDMVHVAPFSQKIKHIRLYNLQGGFMKEFFTGDFSVSDLPVGIYMVKIQTDKLTFTNKLVKL